MIVVMEGKIGQSTYVGGCDVGTVLSWVRHMVQVGYAQINIYMSVGSEKMEKVIEIVIDDQGAVTIEALGFEGSACEEATKELERVLGQELSDQKKLEWYRQGKQGQRVRQ